MGTDTQSITLRPLGATRAAFALVFLLRTTPLLAPFGIHFMPSAEPVLGWPDGGWHAPIAHLSLPAGVVGALCIVRTMAALALLLGIFSRPAGIVAGACGYLVLAQDAFGYMHHLHMLYLGAILLGITDSGCAFALRPDAPRSPRSSLQLLRAFVASIYVWAALCKLRPDWLDGRALALFHADGALRGCVAAALFATPGRCVALAWIVVLFELALAPALLWRRTTTLALIVAYAMHLTFELAGRVDSIGWQMAALLIVFVPARVWAGSAQPAPATR